MHLPSAGFDIRGYSVHWMGRLPIASLVTRYDPEARLPLSPAELADTDQAWAEALKTRKRLQDLPLYRLLAARVEADSLALDLGLTGYKEYIGTNVRPPAWALADPEGKMSKPIAVSAVAVSKDGKVFLQARAEGVGERDAGRWHITPSGHIHPPQTVLEGLMAELCEELAVESSEVDGEVAVSGLIVGKWNYKPELTFLLRLRATSEDILARSAPDNWEYERLEPVEWEAATVRQWLLRGEAEWVPPGHAALLIAGRVDFGEEWMAGVLRSCGCEA